MKRCRRMVSDPQAVDLSPCRPRRGVEIWGRRWWVWWVIALVLGAVLAPTEVGLGLVLGDVWVRRIEGAVLGYMLTNLVWRFWLREVCGDR